MSISVPSSTFNLNESQNKCSAKIARLYDNPYSRCAKRLEVGNVVRLGRSAQQ
ncbi:hypothetical protein M378DRAFT_155955 [Amanita muscaria Koide BX008]|uniref:Uncharacterized protein n=1 Tax=Amanita muscaria (strain Koide BX008) TaxID=946122 RepID=A0A0C2XN64_AMAMK|nr:hypothetical protein M378DRAFT_155955 [Amanita muscaria Koide BX008]